MSNVAMPENGEELVAWYSELVGMMLKGQQAEAAKKVFDVMFRACYQAGRVDAFKGLCENQAIPTLVRMEAMSGWKKESEAMSKLGREAEAMLAGAS